MAEDLLYFEQINPGFDQMGCIAVTQTVWADLFFRPQAWARLAQGGLHATTIQRGGGSARFV